jgi:DNA-binding transcriptional LysR family regulator
MDSLNQIRCVVEVAERLSFAAAGRKLGVSPSAVGKTVASLERALGVRLFQRTTRRVALTPEGAHLYERYRRALDDLREAEALISQRAEAPRGILRIGLPTIGYRFLLPVLPEFRRRYPDVELDLDFDDRLVDLVERGLDAVIRSGELVDSTLMARPVGSFAFLLCAAPDYLAREGTPQTPQDLAGHDAIRFRFPTTGKFQEWALRGGWPPRRRTVLTCNNMEAALAATIRGLGICYMPDFLARDALANGSLVEVVGAWRGTPGRFWILWPSNRHLLPRLRAFIDFVAGRLALGERDEASFADAR